MNRRGFLGSILAACAAPAIVRADSLMRIVPLETTVLGVDLAAPEADISVGYVGYIGRYESMRFIEATTIPYELLNRIREAQKVLIDKRSLTLDLIGFYSKERA